MRIDAHQHFWRIADRAGQWPPPELAAIYRDFHPSDLTPELAHCDIDGTVVVQSMPTLADTDYLLSLADQHAFIRGVVGWVDLKAADAPEQLARLAQHPKFKGVRPMLQDLPDDHWIDDPALTPAVDALIAHRLCFDALVLPRQLPALIAFARRHPALPIVIDHAAKPHIADQLFEPWQTHMATLAAMPQVHCKLSGLLTEAGDRRDLNGLRPYTRFILEAFGPARILWGSDWPVLNLAGDYPSWLCLAKELCADLTPEQRDAVFGGNAQRFYRLD